MSSGIWIFILLEALVVVGLYALYLQWHNRRLKRCASGQDSDPAPTGRNDLYLAQLQAQILATDARLAQHSAHADDDSGISQILALRLALLRAERQAMEHSDAEREVFWSGVAEKFRPLLPERPGAEAAQQTISAAAAGVGQDEDDIGALIQSQQQHIETLTTLISKLQVDRDDKQRWDDATDQLREKNGELMSAIAQLQEENTFLQEQISALLSQELEDQKKFDRCLSELKQQQEE